MGGASRLLCSVWAILVLCEMIDFWEVSVCPCFAWLAWSGHCVRQSCRDSRDEKTRPEAIECYMRQKIDAVRLRNTGRLYECYKGRERDSETLILPGSSARRRKQT